MSVYVDEVSPCVPSERWPYVHYCHLFADTEDELHKFARKLGLRREWFQPHDWLPHYDLTLGMQEKATAAGAMLTREEVRRRYEEWKEALEKETGGIPAPVVVAVATPPVDTGTPAVEATA